MSGSKLVENLAESLVNELSESKTLDLMNDQKFSEFTDLLWEILDRVDKAEDRAKAKDEEEKKDKSNEDESLDSVKKLAETITNYFGKGNGNADGKTDKILKIVQSLQKDEKEGNEESDEDKKKKKLTLGKKTKEQKDIEETKEKKEEEKKEEEKANLDKQTVAMLTKLSKNFEKAEKERKKQNSWVRKGLKRVERKVGSLIWKALNKFKGILLIGALIFFRKPIINWFKKIWSEHIEPLVAPLFEKLGRIAGGLWEDLKEWFKAAFPSVADWIKNDWPKVQNWFKENWENVKDWFVNEFPNATNTIKMIIDKLMDLPIIRGWVRDYKLNQNEERQAEIQKELQSTYDPVRKAELEMELKKLRNEHYSTDSEKWYKTNGLGLEGLADVNAVRNIEFPIDFENGQWKYEKLDLSAYDYMKGAKGLEGYNAEIDAAYKKLEPRIKAAQEKYNNAMKGSFNPENYTEAVNNATYPEYSNPIGGNSQYSFNDMNNDKGNNLYDLGSNFTNFTSNTQNNNYYFKIDEAPLHHQP